MFHLNSTLIHLKKTPSKPARQPKPSGRQAKIVKVVKNSRNEIVKMIDENGKMFVSPAYQKRKAKSKQLQQQAAAYSTLQSVQSIDDTTMKSVKSTKSAKSRDLPVKIKTPQEHQTPPPPLRTAKVVTGETLIDPTKVRWFYWYNKAEF